MNFERCVWGDGNFVCSTPSVSLLQKIEPFKDNITVLLLAVLVACVLIYLIYLCNETARFASFDRVRIAEIESEFEEDTE